MSDMQSYAWGLTILSETLAVLLIAWTVGWRAKGRLFAVAVGINLVSHPIFWWVFPQIPWDYTTRLLVSELCVALGESGLYWLLATRIWPRAFLLGFAANTVSVVLGLWLMRLFVIWGWI